jgi:CBS domain-containing protein/sporulation protein YlmC with PRC-barrel domain
MSKKLPTPALRIARKAPSHLSESLISAAGLAGCAVVHKDGQEVGSLVDLVFRWDTNEAYPPLSGILVKVGHRVVWIAAGEVEEVARKSIRLNTTQLDLRDFKPRPAEVRVLQDILDHQLVDIDGARVVRAADLYVANNNKILRLVAVDVSYRALLRRLGPTRWRAHSSPGAVIDWSSVKSFGLSENGQSLKLAASRNDLRKLRPSELADLLEDLGRTERQELLDSLTHDQAADALEEMQAKELEVLLRESSPSEAAKYLTSMEPDEAADALRDIDEDLRRELLSLMPKSSAGQVKKVLSYDEETAGGFMNTAITVAPVSETVQDLRARLTTSDHPATEIEAIALVDNDGKLVHDATMAELFLAEPTKKLNDVITGPTPVTVPPNASIKDVAELLINNRRSSVLVVDDDGRPLGRILADDVIDALIPEHSRYHFPRLLS